jgi:hypothetical protein
MHLELPLENKFSKKVRVRVVPARTSAFRPIRSFDVLLGTMSG